MFNVEFHPKALKEVQALLRKHKKLANQFREFYQMLETEPYKFPKKRGKLRACRAISFNIDGNAWRLVFRIIEAEDTVEILAIAIHDDAYNSAERRTE
jgi:mRNA-degrading endonuclease RelE of RelBE toxin-antitoxin system